jgi:hypothetical protein
MTPIKIYVTVSENFVLLRRFEKVYLSEGVEFRFPWGGI